MLAYFTVTMESNMKKLLSLAVSAILLTPAFSFAQATNDIQAKQMMPEDEFQEDTWYVTLGAGVLYGSLFAGASKQEIIPLPVIEAQYNRWSIGFDGVSYAVVQTDDYALGFNLGYDFGRQDDEDSLPERSRGIGDIDGGLAASVFAEYYLFGFIALTADLTQSDTDADSVLFSVGAETDIPLYGDNVFGNFGINATWANDDHMQAYYGVNQAQSQATGLNQYTAESGLESVSLTAGVSYIDGRWLYNATAGVDLFQGDAGDSPIIEDDVQPFVFISASYTF